MSALKSVLLTVLRGGKALLRIADNLLVWGLARTGWGASVYYAIFNRSFDREHQAVLQGRIAYMRSLRVPGKTSFLLRRNVHRLEKGLIMRPRRAVFAEGYIGETVDCYVRACSGNELCEEEKLWARDVLAKYFTVVGQSDIVEKARVRFEATKAQMTESGAGVLAVPYPRSASPAAGVSFEQLELLFRRRRSVRWFLPKEVPTELIRKAIRAASLAPSACNRQPFEFRVVCGFENSSLVAECAGGTAGFSKNIPCLIVVLGDLAAYPNERDRHLIYIDGALAAMQFMLACEALGLASCPINWPDVERRERKLERMLTLGRHHRAIMFMAVGYADPSGHIPYSQKKSDLVLVREVSAIS